MRLCAPVFFVFTYNLTLVVFIFESEYAYFELEC